MKNFNYYRLIWLLVFGWIAVIFSYSLKNAQISDEQSFFFVYIVDDILRFFNWHVDLEFLNFIIRKTAHFSEYALLGALVTLGSQLAPFHPKRYIHLLFALVPFMDETLQTFVPGRSGQLSDCLLDLSGMLAGCLLILALLQLSQRKNRD
ncbi:MAG: VanZ family protein [Erysipelotrichaceae bacterium]|nr:VanZ family protein [Erysipelotrichaceae bacterium]MDY5251905.1 VanZ family protein [Erysipelotrichaceae bacterium]